MPGKIVVKKAVKRKAGMLYYLDGQGNVRESKMNRRGGKKGRKVCSVSKPKKRAVKKKRAKRR